MQKEALRLKVLSQAQQQFIGKRDAFRSNKKEMKTRKKKVAKLDDQTQNEQDYLEPEMFDHLQKVKKELKGNETSSHLHSNSNTNTHLNSMNMTKSSMMAVMRNSSKMGFGKQASKQFSPTNKLES